MNRLHEPSVIQLKHKLVLSRVKEIEISSEIIEGRSRSITSGNGRVTPMKGAESRVEQIMEAHVIAFDVG